MMQQLLLAIGLLWTLVKKYRDKGDKLTDSNITPWDFLTVTGMLFLMAPMYMAFRITYKAHKKFKEEKKDTQAQVKGSSCCAKWSRRITS